MWKTAHDDIQAHMMHIRNQFGPFASKSVHFSALNQHYCYRQWFAIHVSRSMILDKNRLRRQTRFNAHQNDDTIFESNVAIFVYIYNYLFVSVRHTNANKCIHISLQCHLFNITKWFANILPLTIQWVIIKMIDKWANKQHRDLLSVMIFLASTWWWW